MYIHTGVGVPGLYQGGFVPGQGMYCNNTITCHCGGIQCVYRQSCNSCSHLSWLGFGGRGVLPGVATGSGLGPQTGVFILW